MFFLCNYQIGSGNCDSVDFFGLFLHNLLYIRTEAELVKVHIT